MNDVFARHYICTDKFKRVYVCRLTAKFNQSVVDVIKNAQASTKAMKEITGFRVYRE